MASHVEEPPTVAGEDRPLSTTGGAARRLNLSTNRVIQLERAGKIRAERDSSGRRLFTEAEIRRYEVERQRQAQLRASGKTPPAPTRRPAA